MKAWWGWLETVCQVTLRKVRDSNPRYDVMRTPHFECGSFDHSDNFPLLLRKSAAKVGCFQQFTKTCNIFFPKIILFYQGRSCVISTCRLCFNDMQNICQNCELQETWNNNDGYFQKNRRITLQSTHSNSQAKNSQIFLRVMNICALKRMSFLTIYTQYISRLQCFT